MFTDDFIRPDENLVASPNWTNAGGSDAASLVIGGNVLRQASYTLAAQCPSQGSADHYSQCQINNLASGWGVMLTVRMTDLNNFWGVYMNHADGDFALYKRVAGSFGSPIGAFTVTPADGDTIYL